MAEAREERSKGPMAACVELMQGMGTGADPGAMCPMAAMFRGMMAKSRVAFILMIPGAALIVGGVLMLVEPRVLVWLMAGTSILLGIGFLLVARFVGRLGRHERSA